MNCLGSTTNGAQVERDLILDGDLDLKIPYNKNLPGLVLYNSLSWLTEPSCCRKIMMVVEAEAISRMMK